MHLTFIVPSAAALSSLNDPQCNSLRARARGRESFSQTTMPFDLKQEGRGEQTCFLRSYTSSRPRRTPCSVSTVAMNDRYRDFL